VRRTKSESEETRQRILDAAEAVFLDIGVSRASLDRIATEARVTRGAIYWHFANKEELFSAMLDRVHGLHEAVLARSFLNEADPLKGVLDWALDVIQLFAAEEHTRRVYRIIVTRCEYVGEMQDALAWQCDLHDRMEVNFVQAFEAAAAAGQLAPDWSAKSAATTLECFMSGMLDNWLRYDFDAEVAETLRAGLRSLVGSFRARGCAGEPSAATSKGRALHA
jgi:AcrR family transcriptional regulator